MDDYERKLRLVEILNALTVMMNLEQSEFRTAMRAASGADIVDIMPQLFTQVAQTAIKNDRADDWLYFVEELAQYARGKRDTIPFGPKHVPEHYWHDYRQHCEKFLRQFGEHHRK